MATYDVVHTKAVGGDISGFDVGPRGRRDDDAARTAESDKLIQTAQNMFGPDIRINMAMSNSAMPTRGNRAHASTGLPLALAGSASVVNVSVTEQLAAFSDPIKAILGTGVHESQKVIIKRQYVAGGGADIVPERAPARTVAVQEDVREVTLTRYGADIEWNMNLLLRPAEFQREMQLKLSAQEESLRAALVRIGYDLLMTEGTDLVAALINSNPHFRSNPGAAERSAERIYTSSVFGAMAKFPFPVENLMAAAKHASAATIATAEKTVMIIPQGLPELHKYTKPEQMMSFVRTGDVDPIAAAVTGGSGVTSGSTTVYTHVPPRSNTNGAANFSSDRSLLETEVDVFTYVHVPENQEVYYVHPIRRSLVKLPKVNAEKSYILHYRLSMLSGILGVPNGANQQTGELLIGYPSTLVGTDVATETGRMKLRMYLGAVLYKRENVMILPDIAFNGVINFGVYEPGTTSDFSPEISAAAGAAVRGEYDDALASGAGGRKGTVKDATDGATPPVVMPNNDADTPNLSAGDVNQLLKDSRPFIYQGASYKYENGKYSQLTANNGHLGCIDSPECIDRLYGVNAYSAAPSPLIVGHRKM